MRDADHEPKLPATGNVAGAAAGPAAWTPLAAFRLHVLYAPVVHALGALLPADSGTARPRILEIGGVPGVLAALLARVSRLRDCDVTARDADAGAIEALDAQAFDCVVAVDWLPSVAPSRRAQLTAALCRAARAGVVLNNAFETPEVASAQRAVNEGHRAAHARDHPVVGRLIELGLPDLAVAKSWIEPFFRHQQTRGVQSLALWQMTESMAFLVPDALREPQPADVAAASLYPLPIQLTLAEPSYRTLLVASARPVDLAAPMPSPAHGDSPAATLLATLADLEQRRALASLSDAITSERERERREFAQSVASLAAELREVEAQADALARDAREHDRTDANLRVMVREAELRASKENEHAEMSETHARNMTALHAAADARAESAHTHARNLDALRLDAERRAAAAETRAGLSETHARNLAALQADADARALATELRVRELETLLAATGTHAQNLEAMRIDAERRAAAADARAGMSETHARNLGALQDQADARVHQAELYARELETRLAAIEERLAATETHARNLDAMRADAERSAAAATQRMHAAEQSLQAFSQSRAGRAHASYAKIKRALGGK